MFINSPFPVFGAYRPNCVNSILKHLINQVLSLQQNNSERAVQFEDPLQICGSVNYYINIYIKCILVFDFHVHFSVENECIA